jgi:hypothetical protein
MNNLETDEGTEQLVASEASAGMKGGGDDSANARHASRKEGTGDLSSGDPEVALKSNVQSLYNRNLINKLTTMMYSMHMNISANMLIS